MAPSPGAPAARWRGAALLAAALAAYLVLSRPRAPPTQQQGAAAAAAAGAGWGGATAQQLQQQAGGGAGRDVSTARYEVLDGVELVWHKPTKRPAAGVLFAAHGCAHSAADWMPRSAACPKCVGLPEELAIARAAAARGIVLVAISSAGRRGSRCWDASRGSVDIRQVKQALGTLLPREGLGGLPVYALGASSGGAFVLSLAAEMKLDGVCSEIMAYRRLDDAVRLATASFGKFPPTAFIHMPRDTHTASGVEANAATLKAQGIPVKVIEARPVPVTAAWLASKVPELSATPGGCSAGAVVGALTKAGIVGQDGLLQSDPRSNAWREAVLAAPGCAGVPVRADGSALSEVLNRAWAAHEIVADGVDEVLSFFGASDAGR